MISTYAGFYLMSSAILPWWIAFLLAIILTCILGILVEKAAYRPLRDAPRISLLISSIGMSYLIENLAIVFFGGRPKTFPIPAIFDRIITIGSVKIPTLSFIIPVITIIILAILLHIVHNTKTGMAMRAVSTDYEAARLMAIDVNKVPIASTSEVN